MGKKKIVVEGIPNIRLSSKIKDKMKIAIGEYAEEKFPLPDKRPVEAWLEKVGNEAFPEDHRKLLGWEGYRVAFEKEIELSLVHNDKLGCPRFARSYSCSENLRRFSFYGFDFCDFDLGYDREVSKYLLHYINSRIGKEVEEYTDALKDCRNTYEAFRDKWDAALWGANYSQELPEDMQVLLKGIILEFFDVTDADFKKFIEKVRANKE